AKHGWKLLVTEPGGVGLRDGADRRPMRVESLEVNAAVAAILAVDFKGNDEPAVPQGRYRWMLLLARARRIDPEFAADRIILIVVELNLDGGGGGAGRPVGPNAGVAAAGQRDCRRVEERGRLLRGERIFAADRVAESIVLLTRIGRGPSIS